MFYFISGIIVGLLVIINGITKFKERKSIFIASTVCGIGLIASGVLGFIFKEYEFIFYVALVLFAAGYIIYSIILNKKSKNK